MNGVPAIHIVDDDASFRTAISRVLKVAGYEVADYDSATCFLRAIEAARPGCILLDVKMPALGGLQLQEELVKLSLSWPIIFMTGHGDIPTSVRAIKAGLKTFSPSPYPSKHCWKRSNARLFVMRRFSSAKASLIPLDLLSLV
jgi:FixJ family two-component response regulator